MSISFEQLAKLGYERTISPVFERAWMRDYGSDPVATAMQIVENKRRDGNRKSLGLATLAILIALYLVVTSPYSDISAFVAQVLSLIFAFMWMAVAFEHKGKKLNDGSKISLDHFCEHLTNAISWATEDGEFYLYQDEDDVRMVGTNILVNVAVVVLRSERCEKEAESQKEKERCQVLLGNYRAEFTRRHNTLHKLGMASGGYDKYFEAAAKLLEKEMKKATTA